METIEKHTGPNQGGVLPLIFAYVEDIEDIEYNIQTLAATVTLLSGKSWNYIYGTPDTIKVDDSEEEVEAGMQYTYSIQFMIPKDRATVEAMLFKLNNRGIVAVVADKNGTTRLYGDKDNPLRKISKSLRPAEFENFSGFAVTLSWKSGHPAFYLSTLRQTPFTSEEITNMSTL